MAQSRPSHDKLYDQLLPIYDLYRTALMNRKYYGGQLRQYQRWNKSLECCLAFGTSSAIAAWALFRTESGQYAWAVISAGATAVAVLKPILGLSKTVERYGKLWVGHNNLYLDLDQIVSDIRVSHDLTDDSAKGFRRARERYKQLALDDDPHPNGRILLRHFDEVQREIPPTSLWMPAPTIDPPSPWPQPESKGSQPRPTSIGDPDDAKPSA